MNGSLAAEVLQGRGPEPPKASLPAEDEELHDLDAEEEQVQRLGAGNRPALAPL